MNVFKNASLASVSPVPHRMHPMWSYSDHIFRECIPRNNCLGEEKTFKIGLVSPALVCCEGMHICLTRGPWSMSVYGSLDRIMWDANRTMVDLEQHTQPGGSTTVFQL